MCAAMYEAGYIFDGKYEVQERIGKGGFGTVLRVKDVSDGQIYALKYCVGFDDDAERFRREMDILDDLYLENVVRIVESEINHSPPYYVMPLAEGSLWEAASQFRTDDITLLNCF